MKLHQYICKTCGKECEAEDKRRFNPVSKRWEGSLPRICESCRRNHAAIADKRYKKSKAKPPGNKERPQPVRQNMRIMPTEDEDIIVVPWKALEIPAHLEHAFRERVLRGVVR